MTVAEPFGTLSLPPVAIGFQPTVRLVVFTSSFTTMVKVASPSDRSSLSSRHSSRRSRTSTVRFNVSKDSGGVPGARPVLFHTKSQLPDASQASATKNSVCPVTSGVWPVVSRSGC